jgi:CheY-like chemotaxis protein
MNDSGVILLVEDREEDAELIGKGLRRGNVKNPIQVVRDGEEAVMYLSGQGRYANHEEFPLPALVLLDLKLPKIDGFEVLRWLREQPGLRWLRVIALTSCEEIREVNRAHHLGANSFLIKPHEVEECAAMGELIQEYWLQADQAPTSYRPGKGRAA